MPEVIGIDRYELLPLRWHCSLLEDGVKRAGWFAGATIDTLAGINVVLLVFFGCMDTVHWTDVYARRILLANAGLGNNVGHGNRPFGFASTRST